MKFGIRDYAFLAVLAAVPLSAWFFVFQPRNEDIDQARHEIVAMDTTLARLDLLTDQVGDVRNRIDEAEVRLSEFGRIIPNAEEVEDLLAEMHRIADRHRLAIDSIRALKQNTVQGYLEIPHQVSIEGDFQAIYDFLSDLERLPRLARVQSLEIARNLVASTRNADDEAFGMLTAEMVIVVYCDGSEQDEEDA
ncbi:MAG: type 4a pilus biogenesis protein PilO [Phycisphaera sp.]|nr:type 4a pilus biogenesis protein PilO [Phycisphaera sp.]